MPSREQIAKLRSLFASDGLNGPLFMDALSEITDPFEPEFDPRDLNQWIDAAEDAIDCFPDDYRAARSARPPAKIRVDQIYACGEIHGTCSQGDQWWNVFFSALHEPSPAGCNCEVSRGIDPCPHAYEFVVQLCRLLRTDKKLRQRIKHGKIQPGEPPTDLFQPDCSSLAIDEIKRLTEDRAELFSKVDDPGDDCLPVADEVASSRILWNIHENQHSEYVIEAILQKPKKRGNGFTKGRVTSLEKLVTERTFPLTRADEAVVAKIEKQGYYHYYGAPYTLNLVDAVRQLVGADNVALNRQPARVRVSPVFLAIESDQDEAVISFCDGQGTKFYDDVLRSGNAFLRFDPDQGEILIGEVTSEEAEVIASLMKLPPVKLDRVEELSRSLQPLQSRISLFLSDDDSGAIETLDTKLVVLLRSRPDGRLDVGLRVRDAAGVLRKPLGGPMIAVAERDGKRIQQVRSWQRESEQVDRLVTEFELSLDHENWMDTIDDFGRALRFVEGLQADGREIEILWDRNSEQPLKVLGSLSSNNVKVDITSKRNWFGITGQCNFDNESVPLAELMSHLPADGDAGIGGYVSLGNGQWARISEGLRKRLKRLQQATHSDRKTLKLDATAAPAVRDLADSDVAIKASKAWEKCIRRLANAERLDPVPPENLDADLRHYQVDGYKWLRKLAEWGVGGVLADDMGLGKTLQTLAVLLDRSDQGPALVIAPTSVGFNWAREAERFAPDLDVHLYRETERSEFLPTVGPNSLVICSYGLALRDAEALGNVEWSTLVLDEAQAIKNSRSKTSRAIAGIEADWTVALTGTPVENHLGELWSLFHVVSPGVLGGWETFRKRFAAPIEKEGDEEARRALSERLTPFVLRRTKSEVLTELPPRTEMNLYVDLTPAERAEYERVRLAAIGEIETIEALPQIQDQRFKILALMTRLRQISCHAGLVNKQWRGSSSKLDQLCETLENLREEGHRALVFSQFTEHLKLIREAFDQRGLTYQYLDGSTPAKARQQAVDQFQNGDSNAFLISLKAGGTGLNLTSADYVIHMDPWWNPAVEDQATDRAHRIGQDKAVMVYRIIARGTIEEEILALHDSKRDLVSGVMAGTEAAAKLSNDDLIRMLRG